MWNAVALNQCLVMNQNCSYTKFQERSQKNRVFLTERKISPLLEATVYVRIRSNSRRPNVKRVYFSHYKTNLL